MSNFDQQLESMTVEHLGPNFTVDTATSGCAYTATHCPDGVEPQRGDRTATVLVYIDRADRRRAPSGGQAAELASRIIRTFQSNARDPRFTQDARDRAAAAVADLDAHILAQVDDQPPATRRYYLMDNVGSCKYTVNYHDGQKTHDDGSAFYDIRIFANKRKRDGFVRELRTDGYVEH